MVEIHRKMKGTRVWLPTRHEATTVTSTEIFLFQANRTG